jgi:flagellar biosynthesis protein FlhA
VRILEAVGERARVIRTPEALVEAARAELGPAITTALAVDGRLYAVTMAPTTEQRLLAALRSADGVTQLELLPQETDDLIRRLHEVADQMTARNTPAVLVCSAPVRPALSALVKAMVPGLGVVSYAEIGDHLEIEVVANVDIAGSRVSEPAGTVHPYEEDPDAYATAR